MWIFVDGGGKPLYIAVHRETEKQKEIPMTTTIIPEHFAEARAEGVRAAMAVALRHYERMEHGIAEAIERKDYIAAGRCEAQAQGIAVVLASLTALIPTPAEAPITPTVEEGDGWIKWQGGECPFTAVDVKVGLRFRDGREAETMLIRTYRWQHIGAHDDIIAYRIIQPA